MDFFYILLFIIAFLYAAVGHGGASGYLALMALYGVAPEEMKPTALVLNLFVSLTSFIQYYKEKYFNPHLFWVIALSSVPFAFWGGTIQLETSLYKKFLGIMLLFPILKFFFSADTLHLKKFNTIGSICIGASIGFISGLIGIGGGIILSPVLILLKWANQKQTAAISALFIFLNSLSGLMGQMTQNIQFNSNMITYIIIAFIGGTLGAYWGAKKVQPDKLKYLLASVLVLAAYKLLFTNA